ncbi:DUF262 domain-containing protein [Chryseobacterium sp.]|uniref:DUF262 domain-containing protein n=1 Tax=Chryseobacterium sp. TaxID=1871047 RepID=UPI0028A0D94A|nr:DUF262 domain-containing protein [Chryseobacterium sp.]
MNDWNGDDNLLPYDPTDVDIRQHTLALSEVITMIEIHDIELWLEESYQRRSKAWSIKQKSRLVESIIMRIPLPIFYFDGSEIPWKVIDGLHRLTTLFSYIFLEDWELRELEFLTEFEGRRFSELPFKYQRAIRQSTIEAYVINPGTPNHVKLNIFQRINTGGSLLTRQEIRNSYYSGVGADFINYLSNSTEFLNATNGKISRNRMKDKEAILRFIAFYKFLSDYSTPLEKFLDRTMENLSDPSNDLIEIKNRFFDSMSLCEEIFGEKAFYIIDRKYNKVGTNLNIALFETWSVNLAKLSPVEIKIIRTKKSKVLARFVRLLQDIDFHKSISNSTSSRKAVKTRFAYIETLLKKLIDAN